MIYTRRHLSLTSAMGTLHLRISYAHICGAKGHKSDLRSIPIRPEIFACRLKESHSWGLQVPLTFVFPPERPLFTGEKRGRRVVKMCIVQQYAQLGLNPSLALTLVRSLGPIYAQFHCPLYCFCMGFMIGHLNIVVAELFTQLPSSPWVHFPRQLVRQSVPQTQQQGKQSCMREWPK